MGFMLLNRTGELGNVAQGEGGPGLSLRGSASLGSPPSCSPCLLLPCAMLSLTQEALPAQPQLELLVLQSFSKAAGPLGQVTPGAPVLGEGQSKGAGAGGGQEHWDGHTSARCCH